MVSGILAALAAFITAIFASLAPGEAPTTSPPDVVDRQSINESVDALRQSIREMVDAAVADMPTAPDMASQVEAPAPVEAPAQAEIRPAPEAEGQQLPEAAADATGPEGCQTSDSSGDGWASSLVRCISRATGGGTSSVSISSQSSVSVHATSPDDAP